MSTPNSFHFPRTFAAFATAAIIFLGFISAARAVIDDNATKQIWKLKYGVTDAQINDSAWLNADSDGDGMKNGDEMAAGTNPFSAGSPLRISNITVAGSNVSVTFPTENGKKYSVQGTTSMTVAFAPLSPLVVEWTGTGSPKTLTFPNGDNKYFRVLVQDIDTDGDGISDWAERTLGLNPLVAETISGMTTLAYINQQIALPNVVTIAAATPFASEDGPTAGKFTVTRTQNLFPITVNFGVTGTALPSTDYASLASSVTFQGMGATSQDIFVNPTVQAPTIKGGRSVTATLQAPGGAGAPPFTLGANTSATVIINSSTAATGTGLLGRYYDTSSGTQGDAANFGQAGMYAFTRGTPTTTGTIVVSYSGPTIPGLIVGNQVKVSFTSGSLNSTLYSNFSYPVTAVTANSFTLSITAAAAFVFTTTNGTCNFSIQSFTHPATVTRVDPTINFDWQYGTPNGVTIAPNNSADNYSSTWECYLNPTVAGAYTFQLDADDKAEVLLDIGSGLVQILDFNYSGANAAVGTFKLSSPITLAVPATPAQRYHMVVHHVETTGDARCRLQWLVPGTSSFQNIAQANQFSHTQPLSYTYAAATGTAIVTPTGGHTFNVNDTVPLAFSSGVLFTPGAGTTANGTYTITAVGGNYGTTILPLASTSAGSATVTVPSTANLVVGMGVSGTGLPGGEFITAIGAGQITVTTGTGVTTQASTTLTFTSNITLSGASTAAGSSTVNVPSTAGLALGMGVSGTGIPGNEYIVSIGVGQITITTGTGVTLQTSTTLTFTNNYTVQVTAVVPQAIAGAATTAGNPNILVPSTAGLAVGMAVTGTGLPAGEFITAITTSANGPGLISVTTGTGVTTQGSTTLSAALPATGTPTGSGFVLNNSTSTTTGLYNLIYPNTTFAGAPGRVAIDGTITGGNNGIWNSGTPDATLIQPDTFSARWTGQVQPQYSETYTFVVQADDGCALSINGQPQVLSMSPSALTSGSTYLYDSVTGNVMINYSGLTIPTGSYLLGETARPDFSSGNLSNAPTNSSTYDYNPVTGTMTVDYTNLTIGQPGGTRLPGSYAVNDTVELDPTSGSLSNLSNLPYTITAAAGNTFAIQVGTLNFTPQILISSISTGSPCTVTTAKYHSLTTGTQMRIASIADGAFTPSINDLYTITVTGPRTFTVASNCSAAPTPGTGVIAASGNVAINDSRNLVISKLYASGSTYTYNSVTGATVIAYSALNLPANSFTVGSSVELAATSNALSAVKSASYTILASPAPTATTFAVTFPTGLAGTTTGNIYIAAGGPIAASATNAFTVNIGTTKYADLSAGNVNLDVVNKTIKDWSSNLNERFVRIPMIGGVRYDIQLDAYEATGAARCFLSWFSQSQPKQIIPQERLYPASVPVAPPSHISPTYANGLTGGPFSYTVAGSNGATVTVSGLPPGLSYNAGVISGTPTAAGDYQILITITNGAGTSTSVLNLHVDQNAGTVPRELWTSVSGTSVSLIPTGTAANSTSNLTSLQEAGVGSNYGERIRGYITAPVTGNYYFWLATSDGAELWIANNAEPINTFKRAYVTTGSTTPQTWNIGITEPGQKSPWLALEAGQKYYFEVLHKAGASAGDNVAVGWLKPGQTGTAPSEVVPGYALSPYVAPVSSPITGTLYLASLLSQSAAATNGVGNSTLRVSDDGSTGYMRRSYSGLTGAITSEHIHTDPYLAKPSQIIYDIDAPVTAGDGMITNPADPNYTGTDPQTATYKWTILPVGVYTVADIQELIKEGKAYINLHTATYPNGEIRGNYTLAGGTQTFTPPPAPPTWTDDSNTNNGASRFLTQATFGANTADIAALKAMSQSGATNSRYETWITDQFTKSATHHLPEVLAREIGDVFGPFDVKVCFDTWWKNSISGNDQLRQRVAAALVEILVLSANGLVDRSDAIAHYYDTLLDDSFGNFRTLLQDVTLTPGMGQYLNMLLNDKPDLSVGRGPNENYAREIQQLFSIGLYRMWPDGSLMLDSTSSPIPTYSQREIVGVAHVFTGWDYGYDGPFLNSLSSPVTWTRPMREVPARHDSGTKRILNNEVLPGISTLGGQSLDPNSTIISTQYNDPVFQALPAQELNAVHDQLFNHPNTGPFICRQLIQRLVTSNPSRDYLYRVVQVFNNNGSGVRGDMQAVIKAILLDYEARSGTVQVQPAFGKQREPMIRVAQAVRAFRPGNITGTYAQTGLNLITVTTSTPHLMQTGNSVFLEFTDATVGGQPAPSTGNYTVTFTDATHYTITAPGWITGIYNQPAGSNVMTITVSGHWLPGVSASQPSLPAANWGQAFFDFTTGTANGLAGFDQTVRTAQTSTSFDTASGVGNIPGTTFTITAPDTTARNGNVMISRFNGSYSSTGRAGVITIDTANSNGVFSFGAMADHGLSVGDQVFINFTDTRDTTSGSPSSTDNDIVYTIASVPDPNTFTVVARDLPNAAMNSDDQAFVFPLKAQPLTRNGTVSTRQGTFIMDNTDTDLTQTPLNAPTVFNYFLPGYKYPGALASQGITTPEFQITAETTVVSHANFIYNGIFNPSNNTSIASFKGGTNALVMDLSPWMGNATATGVGAVLGVGPQTGQVWTSNANVSTLIDRLNTLLLAGQLPSTAKAAIQSFIGGPISAMSVASPSVITTSAAHGLAVGDSVTITGVSGGTFNTTANATFAVASVPTTTTLTLSGLNLTNGTGLTLTNSNLGVLAYTNAAPTAQNISDRLRAIIHLILTSPDYTIQR